MRSDIADIWFRSSLRLTEIAQRLELRDVAEDAENYWEWVIGMFNEVQLDITRTHTQPAAHVDTRILMLGNREFSESLLAKLVGLLREFLPGPIMTGRWEYRSGNDFDLVVVQEFGPVGGKDSV